MSHKTLAKIAVVMLVVFGATVILYPTMFNPDDKSAPVQAPPLTVPSR